MSTNFHNPGSKLCVICITFRRGGEVPPQVPTQTFRVRWRPGWEGQPCGDPWPSGTTTGGRWLLHSPFGWNGHCEGRGKRAEPARGHGAARFVELFSVSAWILTSACLVVVRGKKIRRFLSLRVVDIRLCRGKAHLSRKHLSRTFLRLR